MAASHFGALKWQVPRHAVLQRIFFGEDEKAGHLPLYEAIVLKARELHLAGATVLRRPMGFGHSSRIHTTKILRLSQDLPIVIEIAMPKRRSTPSCCARWHDRQRLGHAGEG